MSTTSSSSNSNSVSNSGGISNQLIEFDLKINDPNRILVLVRNLLEQDEYVRKEYDCDLFNQFECHHNAQLNKHLKVGHHVTHSQSSCCEKCTYCKFFDLINERANVVRINTDLYKSKSTTSLSTSTTSTIDHRHFVNLRYKKCNYPVSQLEWCEFQPYRSPLALVAFASCSNQAQLYEAVCRFEKERGKYKKTLVSSKLFVDFHQKHEMNEEYQKSLEVQRSSTVSLERINSYAGSISNLDASDLLSHNALTSMPDSTSDDNESVSTNEQANSLRDESSSFNDTNSDLIYSSLEQQQQQQSLKHQSSEDSARDEDTTNSSLPPAVEAKFDQQELESKLKSLEKDIVYLDFLFAKNGIDKIAVIIDTEKSKVDQAIKEMTHGVFKKLLNQIKIMNTNEDKQLNYFSEYLKTPIERAPPESNTNGSTVRSSYSMITTQSSLLSIKQINKKVVAARMNKFKGDLYLLLNIVDLALIHYSQSYNTAKKESDSLWSMAALEGICIASFIYLNETRQLQSYGGSSTSRSNQSEYSLPLLEPSTRKQALSELKSTLKRTFSSSTKDILQTIIPITEFPKNYHQILNAYYRLEQAKFISLEVTFMIIKFLLEYNYRPEAINFMNYAVYISNLPIKEESKIRRYYEIGKLYAKCDMKHLATFYKWVSAGRIFKLMENVRNEKQSEASVTKTNNQKNHQGHNVYFRCLLKQCIQQMIDLFDDLKIFAQKPLSASNVDQLTQFGFPHAKKHLILQIIQLLQHSENYSQAVKFIKYLIHEMLDYLYEDEVRYFTNLMSTLIDKQQRTYYETDTNESFSTKFYKFPLINSLKIHIPNYDFNRTTQIKNLSTPTSGIYIHRYENPLLTSKKKQVYNLPVGQPNRIEMIMSNPLNVDLLVENLNLIGERAYDTNIDTQSREFDRLSESTTADTIKSSSNLFRIDLLHTGHERAIRIPAKTNAHRVEMTFSHDKLDKFKLVGYELVSLRCKSEINFSEIVTAKSTSNDFGSLNKRLNSHTAVSGEMPSVQPSYDVEIIPKLPFIKSVDFYSSDLNSNKQVRVSELVDSKIICISSKLGTCETLLLDLKIDEENKNALEVLDYRLITQNDQQAAKLGTTLTLVNEKGSSDFKLKIDSTEFCSNSLVDKNDRELVNWLEIKYTNDSGATNNQCNVYRQQLNIRFTQVVHFSVVDCVELNDREFELRLLVRSLLTDSNVYLHNANDSDDVIVLNPHTRDQVQLSVKLEKIPMSSYANYLSSINERLNLKFGEDESTPRSSWSRVKFNKQGAGEFRNFYSRFFLCPLDLKAIIRQSNNEQSSSSAFLDQTIMFVAKNKLIDYFRAQNDTDKPNWFLQAKLKVNCNHSILSNSNSWTMKEMDTMEYWFREFTFIRKSQEQWSSTDQLKLTIDISLDQETTDVTKTSPVPQTDEMNLFKLQKWSFDYNFGTNKFCYNIL